VCAVPAAGAVAYVLRRANRELDERRVPLLGVTAAFVFAAQMLNFPVAGGTSGHFLGAAPAAILLGPWLAGLVLSVVLIAQAFVFADGGITALGANVLNMGVIGALLVGGLMLAARAVLPRSRGVLLGVSAAGAWLAVMAGATAAALELAISGTVPLGTVLPAMLGVHALIGIGEGVITAAAVSAVLASRSDLIPAAGPALDPATT
jgi:cobalt/nickel transport system permease protein